MKHKLDVDRRKSIKSILWFVGITYLISGVGYSIWFQNVKAAAFLPIIAPLIAYLAVKQFLDKQERIDYRKVSGKGILVGMLFPIGYIVAAVLICSFLIPESFQIKLPDGKTVAILFVQWIFAGFCEEIGWRGFLLPRLKKIMNLEAACIICGLIWGTWHIPMLVQGLMVTQHVPLIAILIFLAETIFITFILGSISEYSIGSSIWTYVSFHAFHNILIQITLPMLTNKGKTLVDDGGFLLVALLGVLAVIVWVTVKIRKRGRSITGSVNGKKLY